MSVAEPTYQQLFDIGKASALADLITAGRPALTFGPGDLSEMLVAASAAMGAHVATYAAGRFKALTTDGEGQDLTDFAEDRWQILRLTASPAVVVLTLTRPTFAAGAGTQAAGFVVATARDASGAEVQFTLDALVTWGAADLGPHTVNATCTVNGREGNVAAGLINRLITAAFDPSIVVTNAAPSAGGDIAQDDPSLRADVRAFPSAIREATTDALAYHLARVPGAANVAVLEEIVGGAPTGIVDVYVSDINGNANDALISAVLAVVPVHKASGAAVNVHYGSTVTQAIAVQLVLPAGTPTATAAALVADVQAAIVAGVNATTSGQRLERSEIQRFARNVDPDTIKGVTVVTPATDVQPAANVVIRITALDVTVS